MTPTAAPITMREALEQGRVTFTPSWLRDCAFYLANNHVLLAVFLAHPAHPYGRLQRGLVLFNSVAFAFFITAVLHAAVPLDLARTAVHATLGTVLQLLFDLPASMLGTCPCAHRCLPPPVQGCCRGVALMCLSCHTCMALVLGLLGAGALAVNQLFAGEGDSELVWDRFLQTKRDAFVAALPWAIIMYALLRACEAQNGVRGTVTLV